MIGAIVLAAGRSTRMGMPKMLLPWGSETIIEHVIAVLGESGLSEIVVVTGGDNTLVEARLKDKSVHTVFNPDFAQGEMLSSVQAGLKNLSYTCMGALICLGDQPLIQANVVKDLLDLADPARVSLVVPSYQNHRGHPWLVSRGFWPEIMALRHPQTLRDFLRVHEGQINYLCVDNASVLMDMDTPDDYAQQRPA
jgi:molybdenum cofactor cytidylyltransferase